MYRGLPRIEALYALDVRHRMRSKPIYRACAIHHKRDVENWYIADDLTLLGADHLLILV